MKPKTYYLLFSLIGAIVPYWQFIHWLLEPGPKFSLFLSQLFANRISTFFALDVVISAIVLLRFISIEGRRLQLRNRWLVALSVLLVGVSLGLPLFLYLRERQLGHSSSLLG